MRRERPAWSWQQRWFHRRRRTWRELFEELAAKVATLEGTSERWGWWNAHMRYVWRWYRWIWLLQTAPSCGWWVDLPHATRSIEPAHAIERSIAHRP